MKIKTFFKNIVRFPSKIKDFVIRHYLLVILIVAPIGGLTFLTSLIAYNQTSNFCYNCHENKGPYFYFDKEIAAHKAVDENPFTCVKCHKDKTVQTIYRRSFKKSGNFIENTANLRMANGINPRATYKTEQCLICHPGRLEIDERESHLIGSDELRKIGLRFNKRLHYRFETFSQEDQKLYQDLIAENVMMPKRNEEIKLLEKIKLGNCGQCHLRTKTEQDQSAFVDKNVNFVARNPITCAGCHENVDPLTHPGNPLAPPSVEVCQKCHHGKIHGKFLIFKADCEDTPQNENCVKCHPYINDQK